MRLVAACVLGLSAVVVMVVPLRSQDSRPARQRLHDSPTPGQFLGAVPPHAPLVIPGRETADPLPDDGWEVDGTNGAAYRRGELLAKFADGTGGVQQARALREARVHGVARSLPENWQLLTVEDGRSTRGALADLQAQPGVESVSLNYQVKAAQVRPNDEFFSYQWNFDAINVPAAWAINPGASTNVTVAVIDTGLTTIDDTVVFIGPFAGQVALHFSTNPDLVTSSRIVHPYDFVYRDDEPLDLEGHGTHVAGTIAQTTGNNIGLAGIAYNVRLMPLKVLAGPDDWDRVLTGAIGSSMSLLAEAITYATNNGANVINLSLGGPGESSAVRDAIRNAVAKGVFVAIAAGNDAENGNPVEYPAAYAAEIDGAMAVGAVDRSLHRAPYSGFQSYVEICAPGGNGHGEDDYAASITQVTYRDVDSLSSLPGPVKLLALRFGVLPRFDRYYSVAHDGTSMATPHVAAVAALLYSQGVRDPASIELAIKSFARHLDVAPTDCGAGLVDARGALRGLGLAR